MWCSSAIPPSSPIPPSPHRPRARARGRGLIVRVGVTLGLLAVMSVSGDTAGLPVHIFQAGRTEFDGQHRWDRRRGAVCLPAGGGGRHGGQRLRGGHQQPHDPDDHAGRRGEHAGRPGGQRGQHGWDRQRRAVQFPGGRGRGRAGNVYVADIGNNTIRKITPAGAVSTLAGLAGSPGSVDGIGSAARFSGPRGVAVDTAGNVYVADFGNSTIRKITPAGMVSTWAGLAENPGSTDAIGNAARFSGPKDVAVDTAGNVYVADMYNSTIRKITPARRGDHAGRAGRELRQRGRTRQRRAVFLSGGRVGGLDRQRLCGGQQQLHDPEDHAGRGREHAGRTRRDSGQHRRKRQRGTVFLPPGRGRRHRGHGLRGRLQQQHDPPHHAGGGREHAGGTGRQSPAAWTVRVPRHGFRPRKAWRWTPRATSTWRTPATIRSGKSRRQGS